MIKIKVNVLKYPDGTFKGRVRKAKIVAGRLQVKEFLTSKGKWLPVQTGEYIPDECILEVEVHDVEISHLCLEPKISK